ncbi:IucA/IucC family protein [Pseudomonas syringae]|uniref:AcsD protein n=2 Tax=Pseudomonas syringae TaxID=317 RepID=A0AAD0I6K4_PSESX|nr:IucA/IucC family protein [Pseudomonas syringae]AVX23006.1 AcsD protein [Pseudomonas syringae pv. atrofaciens]ELS42882.1 Achromobactin biosynthesis protein AcsD [Pseudomonas syringae pv. syringae B64]MBI6815633.1 IucA/IucC family siderophore biosynthesis protein [Pseudomonas syringae]MBI6822383.1 IucA/IucC family siderophore biosynthesis protein [Pseudomonas syringae]OBS35499.1 AcsD protein [Pseudomonas syringae pv. syringae]
MTNTDRTVLSNMVSELATTRALLNCLIKEFALPEECLHYTWPEGMQGIAPGSFVDGGQWKGIPLTISLPNQQQFFVLVDRRDHLGSHRYLSDVYARQGQGTWRCLAFAEFARQLLTACEHMTRASNDELLDQVLQSQHLTAAIVAHNMTGEHPAPLSGYLASEQGLWFGHPNHPAPKARLWPEHLAQETYAPEFQAQTALHLFEVPLEGLRITSNGLSDAEVMAGFADQSRARPGHALICMHPVQAQLFMQDRRVQRLLELGDISDLGASGLLASPTASMRTWYIEGHDYFIKGSLNVRITNCVRKNAWYELESTLIIDELFQRLQQTRPETLGGLSTVAEPGSMSWAPKGVSEADGHWFREQTGAILRENFCRRSGADCSVMAGTLFARDLRSRPLVHDFLERFNGGELEDQHLLDWFDEYQALLLSPVMALFFNHGIVMEPHLQNAVLIHDNGRPQQLLLRDFEGVKLTEELGIKAIQVGLHPRIRQSLLYSREQGWNRITYCLLINNLSEAVLALSWERPHLAPLMWQRVERQLQRIRDELVLPAPELDALIAGQSIACKTNLKVRLAAKADREANYVRLASPWATEARYA